ncbi:hypothetical protein TVAG_456840 [Trichomonas vaginalis G3]|uniref:Surface antigen BspA-like n=1 Tax=Trichomonas vaginalis (strain ATCC PRA-98 / G3) TaxID=412133 RepID=A2DC08_TRIV3|nr:ribonuclease inhibitor domain-containing protein [Trichomonas vaginalis G3]EAY22049.1 hypothetical protein TVAG_456840 [Trichomonas vaginalis G3]KAI5525324.1 ribonuclease inhibitor domain-containing protein [Trichomonas vaginalis G3]|eukprot:XP_001583035.1 hypothetical protein [Trichomonas vaginalis G3]
MQVFRHVLVLKSSYSFTYSDANNQTLTGCEASSDAEIVIPKTVKYIYSQNQNNYAFKNCRTIKAVSFEDDSQIVSISNYSFYNTGLKTANLSQCKQLSILNGYLFYYCKYLETVILPPNISCIGKHCFRFNYKLKSLELPDSVKILETMAFYDSGLISINISHNSKLEKVDTYCFQKLSSLYIPKNLNSMPSTAIAECPLENTEINPENQYFKYDSKCLFYGRTNSTLLKVLPTYADNELIVPNYVTKIGDYCFQSLSISSIQFHNNIETIGFCAFNNCANLTNISIPENVTHIGQSAFEKITY